MKKQTAVEWLVQEITKKHDKSFAEFYKAEIEQANAMFESQNNMKSKEEIEKWAEEERNQINQIAYCCHGEHEENIFDTGFILGYTACQESQATIKEMLFAFNNQLSRYGHLLPSEVNVQWNELLEKANNFPTTTKGLTEVKSSETGEWQLCPKCLGDGNLARYNSPRLSTTAFTVCDVCNGSKIIAKPKFYRSG